MVRYFNNSEKLEVDKRKLERKSRLKNKITKHLFYNFGKTVASLLDCFGDQPTGTFC